ncbi:MAG: dTDP-4-dehydrorhamnose 3,5-epimerase [Pseudomonadota bacterium]
MPLKIIGTALPDILLIEPEVYEDPRGFFLETYHQKKYADAGIHPNFVQDNYSHSKRNTLRGLHYQLRYPQAKLVYVITGEIFAGVVDIRRGSPTFGQWVGPQLTAETTLQILVPEGFAHGFCVLSDTADVIYKCTDFYVPDDDYGIFWADPVIRIEWPVKIPLLSMKDKKNQKLTELGEDFLPVYKNKKP